MFLQDKASKQAKEKHNIGITGAIYNCDFTRWKYRTTKIKTVDIIEKLDIVLA